MEPFDPNAAAGSDAGIFGLDVDPADARVVLLPVPWEATTSYRRGTANGPAAMLRASHQIDLFDVETGHPYRAGIAMLPEDGGVREWNRVAREAAVPIIEAGGEIDGAPELQEKLRTVNGLSVRLNGWVRAEAERWLEAGKVLGVVGGDHSVPLGSIEAHAARLPGLSILHVDAHADLRVAYEGFTCSHASILHNVLERVPNISRLVQVGIRDLCEAERDAIEASAGRIVTHFDAHLSERRFRGQSWAEQCDSIVGDLTQDVYVTFDIDGLDPTLCPNTGTPVPGGLSFQQAAYLVGAVAQSGRRIVGFDLCEVAPGPGPDEWDANVGARLLYKLIGWTLVSRA